MSRSQSFAIFLVVMLLATGLTASLAVSQSVSARSTVVGDEERTLVLVNNSIIQGNYVPPSEPSSPATGPSFMYSNPVTPDIYVWGEGDTIYLLNSTSDRLVGSLQFPYPVVNVAFDSANNITYVPNGHYITMLSPYNTIIGNVSTGVNYSDLLYDPFINEFYAVSPVGGSPFYYDVFALNSSLVPIKFVYRSDLPSQMAYDSYNHLVYVPNAESGTVSVISPNNTVLRNVTVGFLPEPTAVDSASGDVFVANTGEVNISQITPTFAVSSISIYGEADPVGVAFDSSLNVTIASYDGGAGLTGRAEILNGTSQVLGSVPTGVLSASVVYESSSGVVYVANAVSDTISIISLTLHYSSSTQVAWRYAAAAIVLGAADVFLAGMVYVSRRGAGTRSAGEV
jgi:YVTN family beta-propeller protein